MFLIFLTLGLQTACLGMALRALPSNNPADSAIEPLDQGAFEDLILETKTKHKSRNELAFDPETADDMPSLSYEGYLLNTLLHALRTQHKETESRTRSHFSSLFPNVNKRENGRLSLDLSLQALSGMLKAEVSDRQSKSRSSSIDILSSAGRWIWLEWSCEVHTHL